MCQLIFQWIDLLSNEAKLVSFLQSFSEFSKQMYILNLQRGIYNKATFPKSGHLKSHKAPSQVHVGDSYSVSGAELKVVLLGSVFKSPINYISKLFLNQYLIFKIKSTHPTFRSAS